MEKLTELELKILVASLKLYAGEFPDAYKGSQLWKKETKKLLKKIQNGIE